jgi:hypothetical protein
MTVPSPHATDAKECGGSNGGLSPGALGSSRLKTRMYR